MNEKESDALKTTHDRADKELANWIERYRSIPRHRDFHSFFINLS